MQRLLPLLLLLVLFLFQVPAVLADVHNLSANQPVEVEDAEPSAPGTVTFQTPARYERYRGGDSLVFFEPSLKMGWEGGWQGTVAVPVYAGSGDKTGRGDIRLDLMKKLGEEANGRPALAAALGVELPTGTDSEGVDPFVKGIASKTLANGDRVHFNGVVELNVDPAPRERSSRWRAIVGYSSRLSERTAFVGDIVHEQTRVRGGTATLVEAGWRRELEQDLTFSLGAGLGFGDDSPRWRVTAGIQRAF